MMIDVAVTWNVILGLQFGPAKEIGLRRKTDPDGTSIVDDSTLQAAAHAARNACHNDRVVPILSW